MVSLIPSWLSAELDGKPLTSISNADLIRLADVMINHIEAEGAPVALPDLISQADLCMRWRCTRQAIYVATKSGRLPRPRRVLGKLFWTRAQIAEFEQAPEDADIDPLA